MDGMRSEDDIRLATLGEIIKYRPQLLQHIDRIPKLCAMYPDYVNAHGETAEDAEDIATLYWRIDKELADHFASPFEFARFTLEQAKDDDDESCLGTLMEYTIREDMEESREYGPYYAEYNIKTNPL